MRPEGLKRNSGSLQHLDFTVRQYLVSQEYATLSVRFMRWVVKKPYVILVTKTHHRSRFPAKN